MVLLCLLLVELMVGKAVKAVKAVDHPLVNLRCESIQACQSGLYAGMHRWIQTRVPRSGDETVRYVGNKSSVENIGLGKTEECSSPGSLVGTDMHACRRNALTYLSICFTSSIYVQHAECMALPHIAAYHIV